MKFVRKYTIQFELGQDTRWLIDPGEELTALKTMAENLGASFTAGPRPAVTVIIEEAGEREQRNLAPRFEDIAGRE